MYRGEYLDTEGLVDVLTLKENKGEESGDAAEALVRLAYDFVSRIPPPPPSATRDKGVFYGAVPPRQFPEQHEG